MTAHLLNRAYVHITIEQLAYVCSPDAVHPLDRNSQVFTIALDAISKSGRIKSFTKLVYKKVFACDMVSCVPVANYFN